ncbi:MAG: RNA polymerase sigma factor [Cyclobacteriaceae bacterium]
MIENKAFLEMLEQYKKLIYKIASSYCSSHEDRKDLVQEIVVQLWRSFSKYDQKHKMSTWIYRIALNVSISFYRKEVKRKKRSARFPEAIIENVAEKEKGEELEANLQILNQFIAQLQPLDKALMVLYLEKRSHEEMADILGISKSNVATKISRIKTQLKKQFEQINR